MTDEFNEYLRRQASIPKQNPPDQLIDFYNLAARAPRFYKPGPVVYTTGRSITRMDWNGMGEEASDKRAAANHVGFLLHGRYYEEMLVHAEDGTLLGKLCTSYMPLMRGPLPEAWNPTRACLELTREDRVKAMCNGANS